MSESKYLIQGSTLTAIANALRIQGGFFDNLKPSQMTSYIQNKLMSYGVFDAIISNPTISSATNTTINSSLLLNTSNSRTYMIKDTTLISIANALRDKGAFSDTMTAAQMPSYIQNKIVSQGLINAFYNKTLSEIHNYTATTIGTSAFQDCISLHTVEFTECTTVGSSAFKNCTILSNLSLPKTTTVNASAFVNCKSVTSLTIGLTNISSNTVTGPMTYSNPNLEYVSLPNCIVISGSTFQNCTKLTTVYAPIVQALYQQAFRGCTSLKEIDLPLLGQDENDYKIGQQAFQGCASLEKASFACVRSVNANAFSGCTSLKEFYAPCLAGNADTPFKGVTTFEDVTIGYTTVPALFSNQSNLIKFTDIKATGLATNALRSCSALTQNGWNFGTSLSLIGQTAFMDCIGITELSIQNFPRGTSTNSSGITSNIGLTIGQQAFRGCTGISKVILNDISGILSANAFSGCTGLTEVSLTGTSYGTFTNLSTTPFNGCTNLKSLTLQDITTITTEGCCRSLPITNLTISTYQGENDITVTGKLAFANCSSLTWIDGDFISTGNQTFASCISLTDLYLDYLQTVGIYAFQSCTSLQTVSLPACTTISYYAFKGCTSLETVYAPNCTTLGTNSSYFPFTGCTSLKTVNLGNVTTFPQNILKGLSTIQTLSIRGTTSTGSSCFQNLFALTDVFAPNLKNIQDHTFRSCSTLTTLTLPAIAAISGAVFYDCINLTSLYLGGNAVATLENVNTFTNTPMSVSTLTGSFGSIYVPSSLYSSYITATNWKTYSERFVSNWTPTFSIKGTVKSLDNPYITWEERWPTIGTVPMTIGVQNYSTWAYRIYVNGSYVTSYRAGYSTTYSTYTFYSTSTIGQFYGFVPLRLSYGSAIGTSRRIITLKNISATDYIVPNYNYT